MRRTAETLTPDTLDLKDYLSKKKAVVDSALEAYLAETKDPASHVVDAMRYSLFAGGKRLRPILCLAGAATVGGMGKNALPVACALEMIHTYALIHDDLPVMDDDNLRRGKPTNHKVFGEAVALLAGDGLLTEAFNLIATAEITQDVTADVLLRVTSMIAQASGYRGMIGGQLLDIQWEGKTANPALVELIHTRKTGALIMVSVTSGAILGGGNETQIQAIATYGEKTGLAFQISDDLLDIEGDSYAMGKMAGADQKKGKLTYPSAFGLDRSRDIQAKLVESAIESLALLGPNAEPLRRIARYIIERNK